MGPYLRRFAALRNYRGFDVSVCNRVPTAQGKQGKWPKTNSLSGKTQAIWKFCQNTGKTQGISFAQVVNSLFLKVKDTAIGQGKHREFENTI